MSLEVLEKFRSGHRKQLFRSNPSVYGGKLIQNTFESDMKYKHLAFPTRIQYDLRLYTTFNTPSKFLKDW